MNFINEIRQAKEIRIKNNTEDWFDRGVAELIHTPEKLFLKIKKPKLYLVQEICKS